MSAGADARSAVVESLIADFCNSLERDGYRLEWNLNAVTGILDADVVAGPDSCEECLVSKQLMLIMLDSALKGSGISVGRFRMPKEITNESE
ncbi:MAG: hypothetical protein EPN30_06015 [Actinomycetota bacterium]|nr:MAG: hypothetical protein EPN30_06015 [Actinomycetota bacterium]